MLNDKPYSRRSIRLPTYDYSSAGYYYITICTFKRRCMLGKIIHEKMQLNSCGEMIKRWWLTLPQQFNAIHLDHYIVMPNHIHGIISLKYPNPFSKIALGRAMQWFKGMSAREYSQGFLAEHPLWQRNYYEHIVRNDHELSVFREYIVNNPLQWALDAENLEKNPL